MCRMLAMAGDLKKPQAILISNQFRQLASIGMVPKGEVGGHKDGWGIAWYIKNKNFLKKTIKDAFVDSEYPVILKNIQPANLAMLHLRKASVGHVILDNSHPFQLGSWSFCHNGTIYQSEKIKIKKSLLKKIGGSTDSERFFLACLSGINIKNCAPAEFRRQLKKVIKNIKDTSDYSSLCSMFSNGKYLWVLREYNENNERVKKNKLEKYLSLFFSSLNSERGLVVCSQKLNAVGRDWVLLKNHQLLEYNLNLKKIKLFSI